MKHLYATLDYTGAMLGFDSEGMARVSAEMLARDSGKPAAIYRLVGEVKPSVRLEWEAAPACSPRS